MFSDDEQYELYFFLIQSMQEMYSGGEPIKAKKFLIEILQEKLKKTGGG